MNDCVAKKHITQIVFNKTEYWYVVGWIAKFHDTPNRLYSYKWSIDGFTWSKKFTGYNEAILAVLVRTGHERKDQCHIIPIPDLHPHMWRYPRFDVL